MTRPGGISWSSAVEWESGTEPDSQQGRLAWLTMRNSRDPGALRGGALAARQRRDEIVEHLFSASGWTCRSPRVSHCPPSRSISPSLPQPTNAAGAEPVETVDDSSHPGYHAPLRATRDGEVTGRTGGRRLYATLSEVFAQETARQMAADLAGARRRHRPSRRTVSSDI